MKNTDIRLTKVLGGFSLCLGALELIAGGGIARKLGLPVPGSVVRAMGVREMASGFAVLAHPDDASPLGVRLAGDALDLVVLGAALMPGNRHRSAALVATLAVLGLTALDLAAATGLRTRERRALSTARRTRVRRLAA